MADKSLELALRIVAQTTGGESIEQLVQELRNIAASAESANPAAAALADQLEALANQQQLLNSFRRSTQELEQQEVAVLAAANALEQLQAEADDASSTNEDLSSAIEDAENELERMRNELIASSQQHRRLQSELNDSSTNTDNLTAAQRELLARLAAAGQGVDDLNNDLANGTRVQREQSESLKGVIANVIALAAAYVSLDRVTEAVRSVFETGEKFEKLGVQMQAIMGGIAGGEKATAWVSDFTKNTPLQLGEVSEAFVKLKAFGLDPMDGTMQAITDQALKLGGGFQEVEGISLALGQAWAKQKLQGEEILQMVERGIPVWDLLEKVTGKNTVELQKLSSAGKLGRDVIKDLIDEMGRASAGSAAAQMALFSGQVSNAKDNMEQFYNQIAKSGAMDWLKAQLTELNTQFAVMAKDGRLQQWAQEISNTIVATGAVIKDAATTLYNYREEIATVAKVWLALKVGTYFSSVITGATAAIASLRTYTTTVGSTSAATNAAAIAAAKWSTALKAVGKAGLYTWLITELIDVGLLYKDLLVAEESLRKSQQASAVQAKALADELQMLSNSTGLIIRSSAELDALIESGKLVWDEATQRYINLEYQQRKLAESTAAATEAERQRQELLSLSLPEALKTIQSLEQQATSLDGVKVGVDGFIQSIESARVAITGAGEQYQGQLAILDALKVKFEEHGALLERQKIFAGDVEKAYAELGLTSSKALDDTANKLRAAYELMQESEQPLAVQRQAYLKWAEAAIAAADATDKTVPSSIQAAAAALGLTEELEKLIAKANGLKPATDANSEAVSKFSSELDKTKTAIANNKAILEESTASAIQKKIAQEALNKQTGLVIEQEEDLTRVREIETMNLQELNVENNKLQKELNEVETQYKNNVITAQDYADKKDRISAIMAVVNNLLGENKTAQDAATASTRAGTQATNDQVKANESASKSLREQKEELERVAASANRASSSVSRYNQSQRASVSDVVDYQEENGRSAYDLDSKEINEERERRAYAETQNAQFNKFSGQIDNASSSKALTELYNKINKQLTYLTRDQKSTLNAAINAQQQAIKAQSTTQKAVEQVQSYTPAPKPSYTPPTNNYTPSNNASNGDLNSLTTAVRELIGLLKSQQTFTSNNGKTVRLELALPGGQSANLLAQFEEQFLQKLEQLSNTQ